MANPLQPPLNPHDLRPLLCGSQTESHTCSMFGTEKCEKATCGGLLRHAVASLIEGKGEPALPCCPVVVCCLNGPSAHPDYSTETAYQPYHFRHSCME